MSNRSDYSLKMPFKIAREGDAKSAVSPSYRELSKKLVEKKTYRDAVSTFIRQATKAKSAAR